jgi:predicted phosphodiesterase
MRYAIIADIHGNYEALQSVYKDIKNSNIDKIFCLGDMIGYGPEPEKVIEFIKINDIPCTLGNHELASYDNNELNKFNPDAFESILITRKLISEKSFEFIKNLPRFILEDDILFVHGYPPDNISKYICYLADDELNDLFLKLKQNICFVGHTHKIKLYSYNGFKLIKKNLHKGLKSLNKNQKYIVNTGSVGQPRDGNNNAKYVIFDNSNFSIETRFITYNIKATTDLILKLGFPKFNATRLL